MTIDEQKLVQLLRVTRVSFAYHEPRLAQILTEAANLIERLAVERDEALLAAFDSIATEREACARIADANAGKGFNLYDDLAYGVAMASSEIADAIRRRKERK